MKPLLKTLTEIASPSGHEDAIREAVLKLVKPHADEIRVDALGNVIVRKGRAAKNGKRVMLAAHLDEIGLIVSHVDANGFARFSTLGGFYPMRKVNTRVQFLNGARGVIGLEQPAHLEDRAPAMDKFFVDTGATSAKDSPVKVGDAAVFDAGFSDLGTRLVSKSFDDRVGVAILIEALHALKSSPHEVYFVFTVQEEVGVRGAGPAAYGIEPEIGLAVDVTWANDQPQAGERNPIKLGGGPAIKVKDSLMLSDPFLVEGLTRIAEKNRIPVQREVLEGGSTDARAIQLAGLGARAGGICIPLRNIHSPSEMLDMNDVNNTLKLLSAFLRSAEI
ncbi:MAG: putative aminopeptidase YsdC [Anaerolineales bacterium]|nr:putative aminopeptidase YsdC [Anaerolineales bacterium]